MFFKLLKYDLYKGIIEEYKKYIVLILLTIAFCFDFYRKLCYLDNTHTKFSFGDLLFCCFAGMKEYVPTPSEPFIFPTTWILFNGLLLYITLSHIRNDTSGLGNLVLIKSSKRTTWWLSKCCWNIMFILFAYFLSWFIIFIFSVVRGVDLDIKVLPNLGLLFRNYNEFILNKLQILILVFIMPLLVSITLSLSQMVLSQIIKPLYSFIIMISMLLSSSYALSPVLIGNYSMSLRSSYVIENGVNPIIGICGCMLISTFAIIIGRRLVRIKDFINQ